MHLTETRPFQPGTTGWTASDLDDLEIERQWFDGRYEIVEGVLTTMPPAYFAGGNAAFNLTFFVKTFMREQGILGRFASEVDIVIDEPRVARADAAMLTPADEARQEQAVRHARRVDSARTRILIPPTLVLESVSPGHELHDRRTKRRWYAEFGHRTLLDTRPLRAIRCNVWFSAAARTMTMPSATAMRKSAPPCSPDWCCRSSRFGNFEHFKRLGKRDRCALRGKRTSSVFPAVLLSRPHTIAS